MKVKELPQDLRFISDSQDVQPFNEEHGEDYDSYFIEQADGVILQLFGMYNIMPGLEEEVYKVV